MLKRCKYAGAGPWAAARSRARAQRTPSTGNDAFTARCRRGPALHLAAELLLPVVDTAVPLTLAYRGGAVTTCPNGLAALDKLRDRSDHFDLVLSDVYMPGAFPALARAACMEASRRPSGLHAPHVADASRARRRHGRLQAPGAHWPGAGVAGHKCAPAGAACSLILGILQVHVTARGRAPSRCRSATTRLPGRGLALRCFLGWPTCNRACRCVGGFVECAQASVDPGLCAPRSDVLKRRGECGLPGRHARRCGLPNKACAAGGVAQRLAARRATQAAGAWSHTQRRQFGRIVCGEGILAALLPTS